MAVILGTDGDDHDDLGGQSLIGTNSADAIYGFGGSDWLEGRDGDDMLYGGDGVDTIKAGKGNDIVNNGTGTGWLDGGAGIDGVDFFGNDAGGFFDLEAGTARLGPSGAAFTMTNFENIWTGGGNDIVFGTNGKNMIQGNYGNDTISAGGGNDTVYGGEGKDYIDGGGGKDFIDGGAGDDVVSGGAGNDTFEGGAGNDDMHGGTGFDTLSYKTNAYSIHADVPAFAVHHNGSNEIDQITSIEKVIGSSFNDYLLAGATTQLDGFSGDDFIYSGSGANKLTGGAGHDFLHYGSSTSGTTVNLASNKASGGWAQGDKISGFESVMGSYFADKLTGSSGANTLYGLDGNDKLVGGGGADTLNGGLGKDELWGGTGADRFAFSYLSDSLPAVQRDIIKDFSKSQGDRIDLSDLGGLSFIGTAAFSAANQVRFQQSGGNTIVEVNTSGNDSAEMEIQLSGTINLQVSDFLL